MKIRTFFLTLVINIFLMYMVTILYEYIDLSERFTSLEQTISSSVEGAVDASIGAEELFSSGANGKESSNLNTNNFILVLDDNGNLYNINIYAYAYYFNNHILTNNTYFNSSGRLKNLAPAGNVLNNLSNIKSDTAFAFSYLYGDIGSAWTNTSHKNRLSWTGTSPNTISSYNNVLSGMKRSYSINSAGALSLTGSASSNYSRTARSEFKAFYDAVGCKVTSTVPVRQKSGDTFSMVDKQIPVLTNMGVALNSYNSASNSYTMQNYLSTVKVGKKELTTGAFTYSTYYLTPYSLGVTYIPTKVLYPTILNNINTTVALNKVASGKSDSLKGHYGCIETTGQYAHKTSDSTDGLIVNDGLIEYDLSSLNVAVDYIAINFKDWKTSSTLQEIVRRIEGNVSSVTYSASGTVSKNWSDAQKNYNSAEAILGTSYGTIASKASVRIIARITAQVKVHIPYQCDLLRYNCLRYTGGSKSEHYDIKDYQASTGKYKADSTGLWYEYVTYRCHAQ